MKRLVAVFLCLLLAVPNALAVQDGFTLRHGDREQMRIAITVDDCTRSDALADIFQLSQELDVPITFFPNGYALKDEDADLWRAIAASDCEIGNHCYGHFSLPEMTPREIINTLHLGQERLDQVLGYHYPMQVMRPPFGHLYTETVRLGTVLGAIEKAGYKHAVMWDVSQTDPVKCMKDVKNGSILLFHTIEKDRYCLEVILPQLREQGYEFVTISEMAGLPEIATTTDLFVPDFRKKK